MKKLLVSLLLVVLFASYAIVPACSEGSRTVDFDNLSVLSDEDLLSFDSLIAAEKANRGLLTPLPDGEFLAGRDIATGYYKIRYFHNGNRYKVVITVYTDAAQSGITFRKAYEETGEVQILLEEGQLLVVETIFPDGAAYIEKSSALFMD